MNNDEKIKQLADMLRNNINNAQYPFGSPIPSERELAAIYNTNRNIVRSAIVVLIEENLLKRLHGKGTYVMRTDIDDSSFHFKGMTELLRAAKIMPSNRLLNTQVRNANYKFSTIFGVSEDTRIFQIMRLRLGNDKPISIENTYIPYHSIRDLEQIDFQIYSLYDAFAANKIKIDHIKHVFSTTRVYNAEAKFLQAAEAAPVVSIRITASTTEDVVTEYTEVLVMPDYCKYYTDGTVENGVFSLDAQLYSN